MPSELRFDEILRVLVGNEVEFIVVGGISAILQGSPLTTEDLDLVYRSSDENHARLSDALKELGAYYADPAGRQIQPDVSRLASMRVHLLKTDFGRVDALRTVGDDLSYDDLLDHSFAVEVAEFQVAILDLPTIIATKEHADRPKDHYQLPFLRQLLAELRRLEDE